MAPTSAKNLWSRPDFADDSDEGRLTQTALPASDGGSEVSIEFADYVSADRFLHLVPQLFQEDHAPQAGAARHDPSRRDLPDRCTLQHHAA